MIWWPWIVGSLVVGFLASGKGEQLPPDLARQVTDAQANPGALGQQGLLALAATLNQRGFPKTAASITALAQRQPGAMSAGTAPPVTVAQAATQTGMPIALSTRYMQAKANPTTTTVKDLMETAAELKAAGYNAEAAEILELAVAHQTVTSPTATPAQQANAAATVLTAAAQAGPAPTVSSPGIAAPITSSAAAPTNVPPQFTPPIVAPPTTQLSLAATKANQLSAHLNALIASRGGVAGAKGKEDTSLVQAFQFAAGLSGSQADSKYGPGTAKLLAQYNGDVPIVFYWPKGSLPNSAVPPYRQALENIALEAEKIGDLERALKLRLSAAREKGQGFGTSIQPVTTTDPINIQKASDTLSMSGLSQLDAVLSWLKTQAFGA